MSDAYLSAVFCPLQIGGETCGRAATLDALLLAEVGTDGAQAARTEEIIVGQIQRPKTYNGHLQSRGKIMFSSALDASIGLGLHRATFGKKGPL